MQSEKVKKVACRGLSQVFQTDTLQLCHLFGDMTYQSGMVQLAAMRDRCQVGRIGLDEYPVKRHEACHLFDLQRILERNNARNGNVKAEGKSGPGHGKRLGKTMKHPSNLAGALLFKDPQSIGSGFASVDNQRLAGFPCSPDMGAKTLALPFQITFETVVVQSSLANRNDFRVFCKANQCVFIRFLAVLSVGMNADRRVQIGETLCQSQHSRKTLQRDSSDQCPTHLVGFHGVQKFFFPALKIREIEVAVRINQ